MNATEKMIAQFIAAEEALATLGQIAGYGSKAARACHSAYASIKKALDQEAEDWAGDPNDGEGVIHRCSEASRPYHTDADGPCDVWSTAEVCSLHIQRKLLDLQVQAEAREAEKQFNIDLAAAMAAIDRIDPSKWGTEDKNVEKD